MADEAKSDLAQSESSQEPVATKNGSPEWVETRLKEISGKKRAAEDRADRAERQLAERDSQLFALRQTQTPETSKAADSDTEWLSSVVGRVVEEKFAPVRNSFVEMQTKAQVAEWEARSGHLDADLRTKIKERYLSQIAQNPVFAQAFTIKDVAKYELGEAYELELETRKLKAELQQNQTGTAPSKIAEVNPRMSNEAPVEKTSLDYWKKSESTDELWDQLRKSGYDPLK